MVVQSLQEEKTGFSSNPFSIESEANGSPDRAAEWDRAAEMRVRTKSVSLSSSDSLLRSSNVVVRVDCSVLVLLLLGLTVFQLDRMNVGSALTGNFAADIHIDQDTINLGNQLMFLGIVLLEIPSNILLQKVTPLSFPIRLSTARPTFTL
jgi:hypothetical protein